jgi:K+-transporting ATPase ATPase A chain
MTGDNIFQIILYLIALIGLSYPLGQFMAKVFQDERNLLTPIVAPVEKLIYRAARIDPLADMPWKQYATAMLVFNGMGLAAVYAIQRLQQLLPMNPQGLAAPAADSALNTAISFVSNTNWQCYSGEVTLSYFSQMMALTVQNFVSAATGIAVLIAFIRGLSREERNGIGNFWSDLVKSTLYILMPLSVVVSLILCAQGVVQTFQPYVTYTPLQQATELTKGAGVTDASMAAESKQLSLIAVGPAASQVAIKQIGTNGGGFFNANSAHPLENPTPLTNFVELLSILIVSAGLCHTFGKMVKDSRQGWAILAAMTVLFVAGLAICFPAETMVRSDLTQLGVDGSTSSLQPGGNMEGKEVRFGLANSTLWAVATTAASNGSVNAMHDSFNPIGGLVPMLFMQLGEVVYGGVGSGLYGMLVFAIITVFIAGLMVGRTPEYLGKKIESYEVKMSSLVILFPPAVVLIGTAIAVSLEAGRAGVFNPGPHGFSEILYAFSSAGNNNGSAFAGLSANTPFYNCALGCAMFIARYWLAIPVLAIAGSLAKKKKSPESIGTMPTHNGLFITLLIGVVLIFGALTFVPALALGPIVEHLMLTDLSGAIK